MAGLPRGPARTMLTTPTSTTSNLAMPTSPCDQPSPDVDDAAQLRYIMYRNKQDIAEARWKSIMTTIPMDEERGRLRRAGRPRSEASRRLVLAAAYAVLVEAGLPRFSVEAVSTRSGVARTTIYRWWPTKGTLAVESLLVHLRPQLTYASKGSAAAALAALVCSLTEALAGPAGRVSASILAEAQGDEETRRRFVTEFSDPLRRETEALLRRGIGAGEFRDDLDVERTIDAAVGAVYLRLLLGRPLSREWADALVETLLRGIAAR